MLVDTIGLLCDDPSASAELQRKVLPSYGLSDHQRTVKWLDPLGLGENKPSVHQS
jgi:hypothetical protein